MSESAYEIVTADDIINGRVKDRDLIEVFAHYSRVDKDSSAEVHSFQAFSLVAEQGIKSIKYESYSRDDGALLWLNHDHARAIGRVLNSDMDFLILSITCEEEGAFAEMTRAVGDGVVLRALAIAHLTADEVTVAEARAVGGLLNKLGTQTFQYWAQEYDPGCLEALHGALVEGGNTTLKSIGIGDSSKPDGEDQIEFAPLAELAAKNAG